MDLIAIGVAAANGGSGDGGSYDDTEIKKDIEQSKANILKVDEKVEDLKAQDIQIKALIDAIKIPDVPVQSVNGKTGAVSLSASDVGAASEEAVNQLSSTVTNQQTAIDNSVLFTAQKLTAAQKAQARENIGASAGEDVEPAESVEWLNENGDTSKKYVLPDGYIYAYMEKYVEEKHNANTGLINQKPNTSQNYESLSAQSGVLTSDLIPFDSYWRTMGSTERSKSTVTISGLEKLVPVYNNYSLWVFYYKTDGSFSIAAQTNQIQSIDVASGTEIGLPLSFYLKDSNLSPSGGWASTGYMRIVLGISTSGNITAEDVADVVINVPYYDFVGTVSGWFSTGQQHSNDKATQQNSADIAALKERTDTLETDVAELKNGNLVNIQTGQKLYAVGDSITYGYGIGGNDYSWVKHVIDRNGYDAENSINLGQSGLGFCSTSTSGNTINDVVGGTSFSGADIVTVALGINDWKNANATLTDFWAGMEHCFNKIRTDNPYCKIFYILPFNARFLGSFDTFWCLGAKGDSNTEHPYAYTLQTFINMIKAKFEEDTFKAFHVHVIDMVECPAINRYNIMSSDTLIDSIHPSAACNVELGKEIARRIALT